jgi:ATP/maltotriose-dependent transcriptional regulator MalT
VSNRIRAYVAARSETEGRRLRADLIRAGWAIVESPRDADIVVGPAAGWRGEPEATRFADGDGDRQDRLVEPLTARELDVLALLADGVGNREIAGRLGISEHTVKFHLSAIFGKLGASTRTDAVRRAIRSGLVDL